MKILSIILGALGIILLGFVAVYFVALGMDLYKSMKHGTGWVYQDKNGTAVREIIKEENDCVYFVDVWDNQGKICGAYQITRYNE